jgi:hypothetical protein
MNVLHPKFLTSRPFKYIGNIISINGDNDLEYKVSKHMT